MRYKLLMYTVICKYKAKTDELIKCRMRHLRAGILSEKCVVGRLRRCALTQACVVLPTTRPVVWHSLHSLATGLYVSLSKTA